MATSTAAKSGQAVIRAYRQGIALRKASDGGMPTLHGHFAVFNRWAEIDSWMEGHFLERIAPGAFKKTFREQTPKVLFQHGQDPQVGDKPLGPVESLAEDAEGAAYEVPLLDTAYNRELLPGLEAGLYGASFRFKVMREEMVDEPDPSDDNPRALPERTIKEAQVLEFGPVTFPAYAEATAGVRSLTDRFLFEAIERDPSRARELFPESLRAAADTLRMDSEDLSTLAQIIQLGTQYIDEQDEPGDQVNVPKMEAIIASVTELIPYEVAENEGDEPEDEDDAGRSQKPGRTLPASTPSSAGTPDHRSRPSRDTSDAERREQQNRFRSREEWQEWLTKS
jgi:HK97 family phage prohead protease